MTLAAMDALVSRSDITGARVVDVGCGRGDFTTEIADRYPSLKEAWGCDFSGETIALAQREVAGSDRMFFRKADLLAMPFGDEEFDVTLCINMLHHITPEELPTALSELARITRRDMIVEIKNNENYYYRHPKRSIGAINVYPTTVATLTENLSRCGFQLVREKGIFLISRLSPILVLVFSRKTDMGAC